MTLAPKIVLRPNNRSKTVACAMCGCLWSRVSTHLQEYVREDTGAPVCSACANRHAPEIVAANTPEAVARAAARAEAEARAAEAEAAYAKIRAEASTRAAEAERAARADYAAAQAASDADYDAAYAKLRAAVHAVHAIAHTDDADRRRFIDDYIKNKTASVPAAQD